VSIALFARLAQANEGEVVAQKKPNILVTWGDDIGFWNLSHINHGMMGYQTPNIDRIAKEGLYFSDYYGEQSCTAGHAPSSRARSRSGPV
jgi:arylsulfatase A-like enzyme